METRLEALEERVRTLEALISVRPPAFRPAQPPPRAPAQPTAARASARPPLDWDSRVVAGIGIVGALLAPVLVDAGRGTTSLALSRRRSCRRSPSSSGARA